MIKLKKQAVSKRTYFWVVIALLTVLAGLAIFSIMSNRLINSKYSLLATGLIIFLAALIGLLVTRRKAIAKVFGFMLLTVFVVGFSYAISLLNSSAHLINSITDESAEVVKIESDAVFNVYLSGIDTYGSINTVSRSDVNIVATVNLTKKKLLLTSIPRDSYVPIALGGNNQKDKLTHAGNYGIQSSVKTIENLLDIEMPVYFKVNFSSFVKIIDVIGGITVENPVTFESVDGKHFSAGSVVLNGEQALSFVRERKNLGGDIERGKNQQRVVEAVIRKMARPSALAKYQELFNVIGNSIQTNMSAESLIEMINKQSEGGDWSVKSIVLDGHGQTGGLPSYAMPNHQLYMYVLDEASIVSAKQEIAETSK